MLYLSKVYDVQTKTHNYFNFTKQEEAVILTLFPMLNALCAHFQHVGEMVTALKLTSEEYALLSAILLCPSGTLCLLLFIFAVVLIFRFQDHNSSGSVNPAPECNIPLTFTASLESLRSGDKGLQLFQHDKTGGRSDIQIISHAASTWPAFPTYWRNGHDVEADLRRVYFAVRYSASSVR